MLDEVQPDVIVHCAANRFPDSCTKDPVAARKLNVESSKTLAEAAVARGIFLIYISTDYVFSGRPGEAPYKPSSRPEPPNMYVDHTRCTSRLTNPRYGQTKHEGEQAVLSVGSKSKHENRVVVLRVPILYGSCDLPQESAVNALMSQLWAAQDLKDNEPKIQVDDYALRYPTNTQDVGRVCREISKMYLDPSSA